MRRVRDRVLRGACIACGVLVWGLLALLMGYILRRGLPRITWELLTTCPSRLRGTEGLLPYIVNTLYIVLTALALALALPLGVGAAVYLTEYARSRPLAAVVEFAAESLAGIPSIVYGLVGMIVFTRTLGVGVLSGSLTLAVMILPTILRTTQESLKSVPRAYREGALSLGAGKWYAVRTAVLPAAMEGIVTGCILAVGRIVGESAALLFTAGFGTLLLNYGEALWSSSATLTVALYLCAGERGEPETAFAVAAVLMVLTLALNLSAKWVGRRMGPR